MENQRRSFLKQLAAGTAWAALGFGSGFAKSEKELSGKLQMPFDFNPGAEEDWEKIRAQFEFNEKQAYLNNGTIGLMSAAVMQRLQTKFERLQKGIYNLDDDIRENIGKMLGVSADEIALTYNTTQGINIIAQGIKLRKGDEVILSDQEHVGNALPWINRARRSGIKLKVLRIGKSAAENLNRLESLVNKKTRVIALPHITCTTGLILPIKEISDFARTKGILTFFDGAHGPGMLFPNLREIGCDFYASCGHKWLCGPAGTGFVYLKKDSMPQVDPIMVGANTDKGWDLAADQQIFSGFVETAHRFEYGTQNNAIYQGLSAGIEFMEQIGFQQIKKRVTDLAAYLQSQLLEKAYIEMLSPQEEASRSAMIGFRVKGLTLETFRQSELTRKFRLRWVPESNLDSIRVSTHLYNQKSELDQLVETMDALFNK